MLPSILILSISALPLVSRMPGIVTVSLLALPSVVLPLTVRLDERVALFVTPVSYTHLTLPTKA